MYLTAIPVSFGLSGISNRIIANPLLIKSTRESVFPAFGGEHTKKFRMLQQFYKRTRKFKSAFLVSDSEIG
jgi:hypothetical protein